MKQIYKKGRNYPKHYLSKTNLYFDLTNGPVDNYLSNFRYDIFIYYKGLPEVYAGYVEIVDEGNKYRLAHLKRTRFFTEAAQFVLENDVFNTLEGLFENISVCINEDAYNEAIRELEKFE